GAVPDRVLLASAALPRDRMDVSRGLWPRRAQDAAGRRWRRHDDGAANDGLHAGADSDQPAARIPRQRQRDVWIWRPRYGRLLPACGVDVRGRAVAWQSTQSLAR